MNLPQSPQETSMDDLLPRSRVHSLDMPRWHASVSVDLPDMELAHAKFDGALTASRRRRLRIIGNDYNFLSHGGSRGQSGFVRQAKHEKGGHHVTVKSFSALSTCSDVRNILLAGVEAHRQLDHEHVAKVEDIYVTSCAIHVVMELLEGGDLCTALAQRGQFSEEDAKIVLRQVLEAVDHMHQQNIAHRSIKLESIMFAKVGGTNVKLVDFGLATEWDGITKMSVRCGTPDFSSPDMMRGAYTEKADMWSIGVVAYMLLTGEPLYRGSDWDIHTQAKAGKSWLCKQLFECSAAAQDLVNSLLAHNPVLRLSAEEALSHPWFC